MADSDIHKKLFDASSDGCETEVRELLAAGAEPDRYKDSYGDTALAEAAYHGRDSTVSILIQHGADINRQGNHGYTALIHAAAKGKNEVTATLIVAGADLNKQDKTGNTALHRARQSEVGVTLIKAGAELNIRNKEGETPLNTTDHYGNTMMHYAAEKGDNKEITTLIKAGAELNIKNNSGETALGKAATSGHYDVVTTLINVLASKMMNKDPSNISSVLDILSKNVDKLLDYQKTKENLGIEERKVEQKPMFYNVPCKDLDGKSLLVYIDSQSRKE